MSKHALGYSLKETDSEIHSLIELENSRQEKTIELIASENYASKAVMSAQGSVLTNKYAEGLPYKRYYGGCIHVDKVEEIAIERAKELFSADFANVQPHSGSQANSAALLALANPQSTILGMRLSDGGHLTHGMKINFSGRIYNALHYGLDFNTELINYDEIAQLAKKHSPAVIIAGYSAYSRELDFRQFRKIADSCGASLLVDMAHFAGLVASKHHSSPLPYADIVTTTTHKTLRGPRGGLILARKNDELTKRINSLVFPGIQGGPLMHVIAAKAVCFKEAQTKNFISYQKQTILNAQIMANTFIKRGIHVTSGGTDNHLFLLRLVDLNLTGQEAEGLLEGVGITVNKNTVPRETQSPFVTSGLRIGTPAITTRGFKEKESKDLANAIVDVLKNPASKEVAKKVIELKESLCKKYPVYKTDS